LVTYYYNLIKPYKVQYRTLLSELKLTERLVQIPVERSVRDKIKELKSGKSYSEYLFSLTKKSEGQALREQEPTDEPQEGSSNNG